AEAAPSIRLACAGTIARETRSVDEAMRRRMRRSSRVASVLRIAALAALLAGAAYWYFVRTRASSPSSALPAPEGRPSSAVRDAAPARGGSYGETGSPSSALRAAEATPAPVGTLSSSPPPADKPVAARPESKPKPAREPELLKDPVPRVTAILTAADRRLASIGDEGKVVGVGDTLGRRVVVGIDDQTVVFQEPSGVRIRVGLGGRLVGVERVDR